ncbi:MAG: S41 family peptidase [Clostridiales bacterium]|nr:MAG: S41 family peptidase [Clostridiales bacterium]
MVGKTAFRDFVNHKKNTQAKTFAISIERDGKMTDVNVVPGEIETVQVSGKMLDGGISYIRISMFEGHCTEQLKTALDNAKNSGAKGIIFDVRNNPGGALDIITNCVDQILDEGIILTVRDKNGKEEVYKAKDKEKNRFADCNSHKRADRRARRRFSQVLCTVTAKRIPSARKPTEKALFKTVFDLGDKSIAKITTAKYFYAKKMFVLIKIGLEPDKKVELDEKYKNVGKIYPRRRRCTA